MFARSVLLVEIFRLMCLSFNPRLLLRFPQDAKSPICSLYSCQNLQFLFWQLQSFVLFFAKIVFDMVKTEPRSSLKYGHFSIKVVQISVVTVFPISYTCMLATDYPSVEFIVCCRIRIALQNLVPASYGVYWTLFETTVGSFSCLFTDLLGYVTPLLCTISMNI